MHKEADALALFAVNASRDFGEQVAQQLGIALGAHEEREFDDGEHKIRPRVNVRAQDVYVIQSLYSDPTQSVNDKLCRMLFFLGALRDAAAGRVPAVIPHPAYPRKASTTQGRDRPAGCGRARARRALARGLGGALARGPPPGLRKKPPRQGRAQPGPA